MDDCAPERVAYPVPDPKEIFIKIMDWLESNRLEMADEPESQLADDYMVGWETLNAFEKKQLGLLMANGLGEPNELKEATRYSLLRGVEEWDMMISCAKSMKEKESNRNSLDGQDVLTYLSKLITPTSAEIITNPVVTRNTLEGQLVEKNETDKGVGVSKVSRKKHKRKRKPNNASHFFAGPPPPAVEAPSLYVLGEKVDNATKKAKKERRRAKRAKLRGFCERKSVPSPSAQPSPAVPLVQQAEVSASGGGNLSYEVQQDRSIAPVEITRDMPPSTPPLPSSNRSMLSTEGPGGTSTAENVVREESDELLSRFSNTKRYTLRPSSQTPSKAETLGVEATAQVTAIEYGDPSSEISDNKRYKLLSLPQTPKRASTSKYFTTPKFSPLKTKSPRPPRGTVSSISFPPLSAPNFGLIQEKLATDPFHLLIAVTFLIRTRGKTAIPAYHALVEKYSTPKALVDADAAAISSEIKHLGLSVVRAAQIQKYAEIWLERPPQKDVRYGVKNYPRQGDGSDVRAGEELLPEDKDSRQSAWEIGHMTQGPYAIDSWRIFCRDVLLGRAEDWNGKGREGEFQPEWMRVLPLDKELRAYLRWLWMKEGWTWNPQTGEREVLSEDLRKAVDEGRVEWDNTGALQIIKVGDD